MHTTARGVLDHNVAKLLVAPEKVALLRVDHQFLQTHPEGCMIFRTSGGGLASWSYYQNDIDLHAKLCFSIKVYWVEKRIFVAKYLRICHCLQE